MRFVLTLVLFAALTGCGGSDEPKEEPGAFVSTLIRELGRGNAAGAWESLHPEHQARVSRGLYVRCEKGDGFGGDVTKVEVLELRPEPSTVPGTFGEVESTAVTVGVTLKPAEAEKPERFTLTAHVFETDGRWSWVIGAVDYASYMTGVCPAKG